MTFCWTEIGLGADSSPYALHMYSVSVVHTLLVIAAVAMMVVVGFRVFGGSFTPRNSEPVAAAVIFWDFVVVAGVVVWWCLWFLEGGPG
jgi:heme/copper-type cytochrome/quinol oxidase subunit 3